MPEHDAEERVCSLSLSSAAVARGALLSLSLSLSLSLCLSLAGARMHWRGSPCPVWVPVCLLQSAEIRAWQALARLAGPLPNVGHELERAEPIRPGQSLGQSAGDHRFFIRFIIIIIFIIDHQIAKLFA